MLKRTHLAIAAAVALYSLPYIDNKILFVPTVLISSIIPTFNVEGSNLEDSILFKPFKWIFSSKGLISSYTFCIIISFVFLLFYPVLALPFFLGYSFTLSANSFTKEGIQPFWPLGRISRGFIEHGGKIDYGLFTGFLLLDIALAGALFVF